MCIRDSYILCEHLPRMPFDSVSEYAKFYEIGNTVMGAKILSDHRIEFATWEYDYERKGVIWGHYWNDYKAAKEDFALRSGLIDKRRIFSPEQLAILHEACLLYTSLNNFGAIRNAETLSFTGMAPIYDNGTSMWFSSPTSLIRANSPKLPSKPFKTTHAEQIKLVQSFDWLDLSALEGIEEEFYEILKDSVFIEEPRRNVLCRGLNTRIKLLSEEVKQHSHFIHNMAISNRQNDIQRDIAYSGDSEEDLEI